MGDLGNIILNGGSLQIHALVYKHGRFHCLLMSLNSLVNASCRPESTHRGTLLVQICYRIVILASTCLTGRNYCISNDKKIRQQHGLPSAEETQPGPRHGPNYGMFRKQFCALIGEKPANQIFWLWILSREDWVEIKLSWRPKCSACAW